MIPIIADLFMYLWVFVLLINSFANDWNNKYDPNAVNSIQTIIYIMTRKILSAIYFVGATITLAILGINT